METMRKLPVLLGTGAALLVGMVGFLSGLSGRACVTRMVVAMAVFFVLGLLTRNALKEMLQEVRTKREEKERKEHADAVAEERRLRREAEQQKEEAKGSIIDVRAGEGAPDMGKQFQPGLVTDFIRKELNSD